MRDLARQMREGKLVVKLFLRYPLHAKLYLLHQPHIYSAPIHAYLGSSNLTFSGLSGQGELNTEVTDTDATTKLAAWFDERWNDRGCLDITDDLIQVIDESWAREAPLTPYEVYLKMAYHLAQEAIVGLSGEFKLPNEVAAILFEYQAAAVQIAAHHLNKRGGVLLGDVVGLGKTLMATALARIFQDDFGYETLILCPKNLESMWRKYIADYRLIAQVLPISQVIRQLPGAAPLPPDHHRRKPQPPQPRGAALRRDPRLHRNQREQGDPAFGYTLQQKLSRSVGAASPVHPRRS